MRAALALCLCLGVAGTASAKPAGAFNCGAKPPSWADVCDIKSGASDAELRAARRLSEQRGILWWFFLDVNPPHAPAGALAEAAKARTDAAGLTPYIIALSLGEEWYERLAAGEFAPYGLGFPSGVPIVHDWLGRQQTAAHAVFGVPVVWLTTLPNNDRTLGAHLWRPIPASTHAVAVDAYVPAGGTFAAHVAPVLAHAEVTTALPLVLIPQWFHMPGHALWDYRPTVDDIEQYRAWAARPRWVATFGFSWLSGPSDGIIGLADLPDLRAAVESFVRGQ
jgi:hypothetical protein